jgi:hypothetical protein
VIDMIEASAVRKIPRSLDRYAPRFENFVEIVFRNTSQAGAGYFGRGAVYIPNVA